MNRKKACSKTLLFPVILFVLVFLGQGPALAADLKKVIMAEGMQPPAATIYVAKAKGYWEEQGLDVVLKPFTMGRLCLDALLGGRADAAFMAETPPMLAAFKNQPLRLVAAMESSNKNTKVLVRKDLGISKPADLLGKKVAVSVGTNGEFFMAAYLKANGIDRKKLKVIHLSPADMVTAIAQGGVVAVFTWEPHITNAKKLLGDKAEMWFGGKIYREGFYLAVMENYLKENPKVVEGLLRGMIKAEKFIKENPDEALKIIAPRVNMELDLLKSIWQWYDIRISLDQFHLDTLTREGQWAMDTGIAPKGAKLPDYREILDPEPLKQIDPSRVTIN